MARQQQQRKAGSAFRLFSFSGISVKTSCAVLLTVSAMLSGIAYGNESGEPLEQDIGAWAPITLQVPVYKKLSGYCELQPRWQRLEEQHFSELINRSGLAYDISKKWSVAGGYYWSTHFNPEINYEHRLWEQLTFSNHVGRLRYQNRLRLEESWRKSYEGVSVRVRDQIKITRQLRGSRWYLVCSEEPFFNLNSPEHGPVRGFSQNRLFIGIGRQLGELARLECGYMNQFKNGRNGKPDEFNHVLVAQLSIDLRKLQAPRNWKLATKAPKAASQ